MNTLKCIITSALLLIVSLSPILSQSCGTVDEAYDHYEDFKKENSVNLRSDYVVPVQLHILSEDDGHNEVNVSALIHEIKRSSDYFKTVGIELRLCGINHIKDSDLYHFAKSRDNEMIETFNVPDVINVYIVETLVSQNGTSLCGFAYYPWSDSDIILVMNSCATNGSTIAHEIGHALGLYHTHSVFYGEELVNQSNCEYAGDLLCDTPADPRLSFLTVNAYCSYTGLTLDSNGAFYRPDPRLLMSYSRKECRYIFSDDQGTVMRNVMDEYYLNLKCPDQPLDSKTIVYPNPTNGILNIVLFDNIDFEANLYNLSGVLIRQWINKTSLSIPSIPEGIYILEIKDRVLGHKAVRKIVLRK